MNNITAYNKKAEYYAKYRWDYAPEAVQRIIETACLSTGSTAADIGSGTGILTRHLAEKAGHVYAVEINQEMQDEASRWLSGFANCTQVIAGAEATGLEDSSIDLITVAQAIHWFEPTPTRREFRRILKPGGWLAVLRNYPTHDDMGDELNKVCTPEFGVTPAEAPKHQEQQPVTFYYAPGQIERLTFPFSYPQDWEHFFGSLLSASFMPNEDHPKFAQFTQAVRAVFDRHSQNGIRTVFGETELYLGRMPESL